MNIDLVMTFNGPTDATDEDFGSQLEAIADALYDTGRDDIDISATLTKRLVTFTVFGQDEDMPSVDAMLSDIRSALHTAGVVTAGWEKATAHISTDFATSLVAA